MSYMAGRMAEAWNEITRVYFIREKFIRLIDIFILRKLPARFENVLDIGCGTGSLAKVLAGSSRSVAAVDIAPEMLELAKTINRSSNIEYINADFNSLNLKKDFFDLIISIDTLHYLDMENTFLKTRESLKNGGTLLIADLIELKTSNLGGKLKQRIVRSAHLFFYVLKTERLNTISVYWGLLKHWRKWKRHGSAMRGMDVKCLSLEKFSAAAQKYLPGCNIELIEPFGWAIACWRKN